MIVSNYTDLSPAMRTALISRTATRQTAGALRNRGLIKSWDLMNKGRHPLNLTEAGERARAALVAPQSATPAKVASILQKATDAGLTVEESEPSGRLRSWTVHSPENPTDDTQVWIYWTPGRNGGRLGFTHYARARRKLTRKSAVWYITEMGESLQRHRERQARIAQRYQEEAQRAEGHDVTAAGWFQEGQTILLGDGTWHQVGAVHHHRDGRIQWVATTVNGGYGGRQHIYGDHPKSEGPLTAIDQGAGLQHKHRRRFPSLRAALGGIELTMKDQRLSGWACGRIDPDRIVINVPDGTDPTRHLVLLKRYVPYHAEVRLLRSDGIRRTSYPTIIITAKN